MISCNQQQLGATQVSLPRRCVLVVDDSEFVRDAVTSALNDGDRFEAMAVRNGREALEILATNETVLAVVLDLKMPILDGRELLLRLRRSQRAQPFVIVLGRKDDRRALEECLSLGADEILNKPVDVRSLGRLLQRVALDNSQWNGAPQ